jgi:hypothetical protein
MRKYFSIGNKFLTDVRVEPLFNRIIPMKKKRMDGYILYVGESDLFNNIEGGVAKIGYKDGQFKAVEGDEIESGWMYLNDKDLDFDSVVFPDQTLEVINGTESENIDEDGAGIWIVNEEKEGDLSLPIDLSKMKYPELYAYAVSFGFVAEKSGNRKKNTLMKYLESLVK